MLFENNHIVNGDDCITVGSGASGIQFRYVDGIYGLMSLTALPPGIHTVKVDMVSQSDP